MPRMKATQRQRQDSSESVEQVATDRRSEESKCEEYEVDKIVAERDGENGQVEFLVKWVGYGMKHNCWEGLKNLQQCQDALAAWEATKAKREASKNKQSAMAKRAGVRSLSRLRSQSQSQSRSESPVKPPAAAPSRRMIARMSTGSDRLRRPPPKRAVSRTPTPANKNARGSRSESRESAESGRVAGQQDAKLSEEDDEDLPLGVQEVSQSPSVRDESPEAEPGSSCTISALRQRSLTPSFLKFSRVELDVCAEKGGTARKIVPRKQARAKSTSDSEVEMCVNMLPRKQIVAANRKATVTSTSKPKMHPMKSVSHVPQRNYGMGSQNAAKRMETDRNDFYQSSAKRPCPSHLRSDSEEEYEARLVEKQPSVVNQMKSQKETTASPSTIYKKGEEYWQVEEILGSHMKNRKIYYLVKWAGYPEEDNSWEPIQSLRMSQESVQGFISRYGKAKGENQKTFSPVGRAWDKRFPNAPRGAEKA